MALFPFWWKPCFRGAVGIRKLEPLEGRNKLWLSAQCCWCSLNLLLMHRSIERWQTGQKGGQLPAALHHFRQRFLWHPSSRGNCRGPTNHQESSNTKNTAFSYASSGPMLLGTPWNPRQFKAPGPRPTIKHVKEARNGPDPPARGTDGPVRGTHSPVRGTDCPFNCRKRFYTPRWNYYINILDAAFLLTVGSFLLTVELFLPTFDNFSFFAYSWSFAASLLTVWAFLLAVGKCI